MVRPEQALFVVTNGTSVWRDRRFIRWWDINLAIPCVLLPLLIAMIVLSSARSVYNAFDSTSMLPLNSWSIAVLAATYYVSCYFCFMVASPVPALVEWQLRRRRVFANVSGTGHSHQEAGGPSQHPPKITKVFLCRSTHRNVDLGETVRAYDIHISKAGFAGHRASLVVEEGRCRQWWARHPLPTLDALVQQGCKDSVPGEIEPLALPTQLRLWPGILYPIALMFFVSAYSIMTALPPRSRTLTSVADTVMFGIAIAGVMLTGYIGLREQGLFPLPLFRGECSAEKTRVFHHFRWKTFKPGRDLAILRFTSNREADIAFLGADGSHATARVGGKYLDHFIACWASPVKNAECELETECCHQEAHSRTERRADGRV